MRHTASTAFVRKLRSSMTDAETRLWFHLRKRQLNGYRFRRQHPVGRFVADFACLEARLVVELDGSQHLDSHQDENRKAVMRASGFRTVRFWNDDVLLRTSQVLEKILKALQDPTG